MLEPRTDKAAETKHAVVPKAPPVVSVVIPTHDRAQLLVRAIRSVLAQTYDRLEIIVVDDASSDDTHEVVKQFGDSRIRYIRHQTNRGGSAARNTGIRAATGEYMAFLDDDDEWEPLKTEEQLKVLHDYDAVLCTSTGQYSRSAKYREDSTITTEDLRQGKYTSGGTGALMARTEVLRAVMFDESLPRYQDWDLFIRIAMKYKVAYLGKGFVRYNPGEHQRITNRILNMPAVDLERQLRMVHKHREFFGNKWFNRHMCSGLLYGTKHRPDWFLHLAYVARRYGVVPVVWALARRVKQKMAGRNRTSGDSRP